MIGAIDIIFAITVIFSVLFALYRGLVRELLGIASWLLSGFAALYSYAFLQPIMGKLISNQMMAGIAGSLIVALIILVIMTIINSWIAKQLRQSVLSGLDRILGLMFGVFRACLLAAICYLGASMILSEKQLEQVKEQNFSLPYIQTMSDWLEYLIPDNIKDDVALYKQDKSDDKIEKVGIDIKEIVKESLTEYKESDKESLDDMIDKISELGDL